jgi:hypothetical protein
MPYNLEETPDWALNMYDISHDFWDVPLAPDDAEPPATHRLVLMIAMLPILGAYAIAGISFILLMYTLSQIISIHIQVQLNVSPTFLTDAIQWLQLRFVNYN